MAAAEDEAAVGAVVVSAQDGDDNEVREVRSIRNRKTLFVDGGTDQKPWKWVPQKTGDHVLLMKDAAKAAFNGAKVVFKDNTVIEGACAEHVFGRWSDKHGALIVADDRSQRTAIRTQMRADFQALKGCPSLSLVEPSFVLIICKWREVSVYIRTLL
jgi:hypothetical protein